MGVTQGSTLYAGSVSKAAIYDIKKGVGFPWSPFVKTEILMDKKPRQLTRAKHSGNPLQPNIKNPVLADYAAVGTAVTVDGRLLSTRELIILDTMDDTEFLDTFPEYQPTGTKVDLKANPAIWKVFYDLTIDAMQDQMSGLHSAGDVSLTDADPLGFYDGFTTLILADADCTQVGTPAVLTEANILSYERQLMSAIPARLRNKSNLTAFCSYADYDLRQNARADTQHHTPTTDVKDSDTSIIHAGGTVKWIPMTSIPKNFVFMTVADKSDKSNLVQGVWMEKDEKALMVHKITDADQERRIVLRIDLGVQYKTGEDIFYLNNV